jgi:2-dehydro-3-deoxyphosphogluconate aldolase/(4S)-4-hydroxy-2-oxoglutarate aldolase
MAAMDPGMLTQALIPVLALRDEHDLRLLEHLVDTSGLQMVELTARTPAAFDLGRTLMQRQPNVKVGMGTLLRKEQVEEAAASGFAFGVTPGTTGRLLDAIRATSMPVLPGVSTASEAMAAMEAGHEVVKAFPAGGLGPSTVRAWFGPLPHLRVCATGGLVEADAASWLDLPNVVAVGGGWMFRAHVVDAARSGDADALASLEAAFLRCARSA